MPYGQHVSSDIPKHALVKKNYKNKISFSFFFLGGGGIQVYTVMNGLNNIRSVADVTVQYVIRDQMTNIENIAVETGH